MLDYEWGNPPPIAAGEATAQPDLTRHIFDQYPQTFNETANTHYLNNPDDFLHHTDNPTHHFLHDPTHFAYAGYYAYPSPLLSLEPDGSGSHDQTGYMLMPKTEPGGCDIGLNLGGRTYFSSAEDEFVNRLYCRSGPLEAVHVSSPRCQAEGCNADLTNAKHYHRRHKVCEFHSKASTVIAAGLTQRFCQQCSRFHLLSEFDNGKRSCRRRLADHNRRRRKSSQNQDHSKSFVTVTSNQSLSSEITSRYEPD